MMVITRFKLDFRELYGVVSGVVLARKYPCLVIVGAFGSYYFVFGA